MSQTRPSTLGPLRVLVGAMAGGVVLLSLVGAVSVGLQESPEPLWLAVLVAVAVAGAVVALTTGFRVPALDPADRDPGRTALAALQSSTILRCALVEAPAVLAVALGFAVGSGWLALLGLLVVPVMLWLCWPTRTNVARVQRGLEAKGARTGLAEEVFGSG